MECTTRMKYIYLVSCPHSGSTIISFLLGSHPDIATVGEIAGSIPDLEYLCSCGERISECPLWKEVSERLEMDGDHLDMTNIGIHLPGPTHNSSIFDLYYHYFPYRWMDLVRDLAFSFHPKMTGYVCGRIERLLKVVSLICEITGKSIFADTSKDLFRLKWLLKIPSLDVKVIYLVRDGRAVMNSLITKEQWTSEISVMSQVWCNRNIEHIIRNYLAPKQVYILKHEDFCLRTEQIIRELAEFLGISPEFNLAAFERKNYHIIGNGMRARFDGQIRFEENWKTSLSVDSIRLFEQKAGYLNRKFGYDFKCSEL